MAKPGTLNWALLGLGGGDVEIEGSNIENLGWESFGHKVKNDDGSTLPAGAAVCVKNYIISAFSVINKQRSIFVHRQKKVIIPCSKLRVINITRPVRIK